MEELDALLKERMQTVTINEKKLVEELHEYQESKDVEELSDILEVIYRISSLKGTTSEELDKIRKDKATKRGSFEDNLFLISTED